jgi:hypothetical protein
MFRIEHNVETGEVKEIQLTQKEIKDLEKEYAEAKANAEAHQAEAEEKAIARQAILDRLGLTADEAALILG